MIISADSIINIIRTTYTSTRQITDLLLIYRRSEIRHSVVEFTFNADKRTTTEIDNCIRNVRRLNNIQDRRNCIQAHVNAIKVTLHHQTEDKISLSQQQQQTTSGDRRTPATNARAECPKADRQVRSRKDGFSVTRQARKVLAVSRTTAVVER